MFMFVGQMGCEALNWILKRVIREERPQSKAIWWSTKHSEEDADHEVGIHGKGYGMPSSHAQFTAFWAVSVALFLLIRHNPHVKNASTTHVPTSFFERLFLSVMVIGGAAAVAQSRIYLNYHTPKQVLVGCAAGALCAVGWFIVTSYLRHAGWTEWALDLDICRYFRIRDLLVNEDLVDAGWERWQSRRQRRTDTDDSTKKSR